MRLPLDAGVFSLNICLGRQELAPVRSLGTPILLQCLLGWLMMYFERPRALQSYTVLQQYFPVLLRKKECIIITESLVNTCKGKQLLQIRTFISAEIL